MICPATAMFELLYYFSADVYKWVMFLLFILGGDGACIERVYSIHLGRVYGRCMD